MRLPGYLARHASCMMSLPFLGVSFLDLGRPTVACGGLFLSEAPQGRLNSIDSRMRPCSFDHLNVGFDVTSDPNKLPTRPGSMISGSSDGILTVGEIRNAIHDLDNDVEITFGGTIAGVPLRFYRFKWRGEKLLQIELSEDFPEPGTYTVHYDEGGGAMVSNPAIDKT